VRPCVAAFLRRRYEAKVNDVEIVEKEDLDLKNHLAGLQQKYLKVTFATVSVRPGRYCTST
jgi:DNA polymerase epsilon subunit 1